MYIDKFNIDRFGIFAGQEISGLSSGLNLFYGHNEAGKSTCMKFFRAMFFGFRRGKPPLEQLAAIMPGSLYGGSLHIIPEGTRVVAPFQLVRRPREKKREESLSLIEDNGQELPTAYLADLLHGCTEDIYDSTFAFDINDLNNFFEKNSKTRQTIYGATFGPGLLPPWQILDKLEKLKSELYTASRSGKVINAQLGELNELENNLKKQPSDLAEYRDLKREAGEIEASLEAMLGPAGTLRMLRDKKLYLNRLTAAVQHWQGFKECNDALSLLPDVTGSFSEGACERLEHLLERIEDRELEASGRAMELAVLKNAMQANIPDARILAQKSRMHNFNQRRPSFIKTMQDGPLRAHELKSLEGKMREDMALLGPDWDLAKLKAFDRSLLLRDRLNQHEANISKNRAELDRAGHEQSRLANELAQQKFKLGFSQDSPISVYPQLAELSRLRLFASSGWLEIEKNRADRLTAHTGHKTFTAIHQEKQAELQCLKEEYANVTPDGGAIGFGNTVRKADNAVGNLKILQGNFEYASQACEEENGKLNEHLALLACAGIYDTSGSGKEGTGEFARECRQGEANEKPYVAVFFLGLMMLLFCSGLLFVHYNSLYEQELFGFVPPIPFMTLKVFLLVVIIGFLCGCGIIFYAISPVLLSGRNREKCLAQEAELAILLEKKAVLKAGLDKARARKVGIEEQILVVLEKEAGFPGLYLLEEVALPLYKAIGECISHRAFGRFPLGEMEDYLDFMQQKAAKFYKMEERIKALIQETEDQRAKLILESEKLKSAIDAENESMRIWNTRIGVIEAFLPQHSRSQELREPLLSNEELLDLLNNLEVLVTLVEDSRQTAQKQQEADSAHEEAQAAFQTWLCSMGLFSGFTPNAARTALELLETCLRTQAGIDKLNIELEAGRLEARSFVDDLAAVQAEFGLVNSCTTFAESSRNAVVLLDELNSKLEVELEKETFYKSRKEELPILEKSAAEAKARLSHAEDELVDMLRRGKSENIDEYRANYIVWQKRANFAQARQVALAQLEELSRSLPTVKFGPESPIVQGVNLHTPEFSFQEAINPEMRIMLDALYSLNLHTEDGGVEFLRESLNRLEQEIVENEAGERELLENRGKIKSELQNIIKANGFSQSEDVYSKIATGRENLRKNALNWAKLALGYSILEEARKRFSEDKQDSILRNTGELFSLFTHNAYKGIYFPVDDLKDGKIYALQHNGDKKEAETALSGGTRDQLYLALRFAYVRQHAALGEPLPLIMDDILVNFDEKRAIETIKALRELSGENQILFFTCHRHIQRLFREFTPDAAFYSIGEGAITREVADA